MAIVDGLILAEKEMWVDGGTLDVSGAVIARTILNNDGTIVIRYDSAVLSTVSLRRLGRGRTELLSWQELR
jgi:hypothetical protein